MSSTYSTALAGLLANSDAINVVSGNLANLSTAGYKDNQVSFEDLVNQSLSGFSANTSISGSTVAQANEKFTQGTLQTTNNPYDAAIQGGGFFVLQSVTGQQLFTRTGTFHVSSDGHLVTSTGQFVEGWNVSGAVLNTTGAVSPIVLPTTLVQPPTATSSIDISANLNANAAVGSTDATFSSPIQVYDSNGTAHALTITYTETAANTWSYTATIPAADVSQGASTTVASGTLTFDSNGNLTSPNAAAGSITLSTPSLSDGATMSASWNLYDANGDPTITQYAQANANTATNQNGVPAGQLVNMQIGANGVVVANFSNGTNENVAQLALASVFNPDSMQQLDGNSFAPTSATANPVIGLPSTGARGEITGGSLETSTVDIASEFTNLLQYERGYQANSKVITTEDQVIQQTLGLIANA